MTKYTAEFISFSKDLLKEKGEKIHRWAQDSNPLIAREFKDVIEAAAQEIAGN